MIDLRLGDCLELMREIPDASIDAVITDPPYANNTGYNGYEDSQESLATLVRGFIPEALRIAKRVVITCGVSNMWLYPKPTWVLSWVNRGGVGSSSWGFCCWQPILVYGKDPFLQDGKGRRPDTLFQERNDIEYSEHPCPKPTNVMMWIVERTTRQGETILDPFTGSGTTGVACVKLNRSFIGMEINPDYFKIAERRIADAQKQMTLF